MFRYCHTQLLLGFSAKLRIWLASASKMEPQSGIIIGQNPTRPTRRVSLKGPISELLLIRSSSYINRRLFYHVCPLIMSVATNYDCPHLLCLSPPIMSVPTNYVCPHQLYLSPSIMSVPTYHVCPHLLCLSQPLYFCSSVPTYR